MVLKESQWVAVLSTKAETVWPFRLRKMLKRKEACQRSTCVFPELGTWKTFVLYRLFAAALPLPQKWGNRVRPGNMFTSPAFRNKRMGDQEFKVNLGYMRLNLTEKGGRGWMLKKN